MERSASSSDAATSSALSRASAHSADISVPPLEEGAAGRCEGPSSCAPRHRALAQRRWLAPPPQFQMNPKCRPSIVCISLLLNSFLRCDGGFGFGAPEDRRICRPFLCKASDRDFFERAFALLCRGSAILAAILASILTAILATALMIECHLLRKLRRGAL